MLLIGLLIGVTALNAALLLPRAMRADHGASGEPRERTANQPESAPSARRSDETVGAPPVPAAAETIRPDAPTTGADGPAAGGSGTVPKAPVPHDSSRDRGAKDDTDRDSEGSPPADRPADLRIHGPDEAVQPPIGRTTSAGPSARAVARYDGLASPGLRITLDGTASVGQGLRYHWIQTRGPKVEAGRLDRARVVVAIPGDATELAFTLLVVGRDESDSAELEIPLVLRSRNAAAREVRADAGDDQVALVGHRITLNGARSTPRDRLAYRWIQADGPRVEGLSQDGWFCSFVPTTPGAYRFLLVVAADGVISEPAEIRVVVMAGLPRAAPAREPAMTRTATATPPAPPSVEELVRDGLASLPGGQAAAAALADVFDGISERMNLYETYNDLQREVAMRLNAVLPPDPSELRLWNERLFTPLSGRIVQVMREEGLELTRAEARVAPLSETQRARLDHVFRAISRGFRPIQRGEAARRDSAGR
jgi:hypothetical protein